jgi:alanine-glyoxylate transaminase/serine-glyoxylate transaminase/serine-pyruvate transaminase
MHAKNNLPPAPPGRPEDAPTMSRHAASRHFLQIPGPTNVPDRVLRAIDSPTIDHRGPAFQALAQRLLDRLKPVFQTTEPIVIYPASGTGAWEAALVNTLSPGDRVLMAETGHFALLWRDLAARLGLEPELIAGDWRSGVDVAAVRERLARDDGHAIKAVCVVHNETSTGVTSKIAPVRRALDHAGHPALLLVDTISSLGSIDYRHEAWGVDVTVAGSQKGLMLPPGLSFNAVSAKALAARKMARLSRAYWDWGPMLDLNPQGFFPYTPATNLLYGLDAALALLEEEGLASVFARHARHGEATRRAVRAWGLEIQCRVEDEHSDALTGVRLPAGFDADAFRAHVLDRYDMSLGQGLSRLKGRMFRIGHLGAFNDLSLMGTIAGVEMGLRAFGVPLAGSGVAAAMAFLADAPAAARAA